jgi:hypothetical protein
MITFVGCMVSLALGAVALAGNPWAPQFPLLDSGGNFLVAPIPEPASMMLMGAGLIGLGSWVRRRQLKNDEA